MPACERRFHAVLAGFVGHERSYVVDLKAEDGEPTMYPVSGNAQQLAAELNRRSYADLCVQDERLRLAGRGSHEVKAGVVENQMVD